MSVLPRPAASDRGLVLRIWPTGETSVVASVLTAEHGLVRLLARGARQTRSRLRPLVQPGRLVELEFSLDPARELQFLRGGGLLRDPLAAAPTLEKSAYLQAALELVDRCRPGHGHEVGLFPLCHGFLEVLSCAGPGREAALFYAFETALLDLLGTRPALADCVHCGRERDDLAAGGLWFSPASGGLVCGDCARTQGVAGARPLTADALAAWPDLAGAPRRWPDRTLPRAVSRDWGVMLHRFLEYHLPGYRLPAALALLRAGRGADAHDRTE